MALALVVKVLPPLPAAAAEAQLNAWLATHRGVEVAFVTQSSHTVDTVPHLTFSLLYTEPTDRDRAIQRQMAAEDAIDGPEAAERPGAAPGG